MFEGGFGCSAFGVNILLEARVSRAGALERLVSAVAVGLIVATLAGFSWWWGTHAAVAPPAAPEPRSADVLVFIRSGVLYVIPKAGNAGVEGLVVVAGGRAYVMSFNHTLAVGAGMRVNLSRVVEEVMGSWVSTSASPRGRGGRSGVPSATQAAPVAERVGVILSNGLIYWVSVPPSGSGGAQASAGSRPSALPPSVTCVNTTVTKTETATSTLLETVTATATETETLTLTTTVWGTVTSTETSTVTQTTTVPVTYTVTVTATVTETSTTTSVETVTATVTATTTYTATATHIETTTETSTTTATVTTTATETTTKTVTVTVTVTPPPRPRPVPWGW